MNSYASVCIAISIVECGVGELACADGMQCVDESFLCDYLSDCDDNSDEVDCICNPSIEFECSSGGCINATWVCDRESDCFDGSDEAAYMCGYTTETPTTELSTTEFSTTDEATAEMSTTMKPG